MDQVERFRSRLESTAFAPLLKTGDWYYRLIGFLLLVIGWAIYAYVTQYRRGLIVTGMSDRISWGLYIALFVFVIAISYGGTLISAILRITGAGWRTPITRMAECITVAALLSGVLLVMIDLGRPDRVHHLLLFARWQSPIIWDVMAITTYLVGSIFYLYLPLIPDLARCRDRLGYEMSGWKRWFFWLFSLGWSGSPQQKRYLSLGMTTVMLLIVPLAIMVHTVLSWIFGMTLREPWDTAIFGIYFVTGAVFSGVAAVIIIMAILRRVYHLEEYITEKHFTYLGYMLAALATVMIYFNMLEYVTTGYKLAGESLFHLRQIFTGALAPFYWVYALGGLVVPCLIIIGAIHVAKRHTVAAVVIASILVTLGMWIERYIIVVGGLRLPLMPYEPASYMPSWVEWSIMAGIFALLALILAVFVKLFPMMAIWEVEEQYEKQITRT